MTRNEQTPTPTTYDGDFLVWTQQQAAALRLTRGVIGDIADVEHVAEELEDTGKRDLREVGSFLACLIEDLIKLDAAPLSRDAHTGGPKLFTSRTRPTRPSRLACDSS